MFCLVLRRRVCDRFSSWVFTFIEPVSDGTTWTCRGIRFVKKLPEDLFLWHMDNKRIFQCCQWDIPDRLIPFGSNFISICEAFRRMPCYPCHQEKIWCLISSQDDSGPTNWHPANPDEENGFRVKGHWGCSANVSPSEMVHKIHQAKESTTYVKKIEGMKVGCWVRRLHVFMSPSKMVMPSDVEMSSWLQKREGQKNLNWRKPHKWSHFAVQDGCQQFLAKNNSKIDVHTSAVAAADFRTDSVPAPFSESRFASLFASSYSLGLP